MQRVVAKTAPEGYVSGGKAQVTRKVLEADLNGVKADLNSDLGENVCYMNYNDLPLNNRPELERMKEPDKCKDSGVVLYMETEFKESCREFIPVTSVNKNFLTTLFTFRINVSVINKI